jgi:hypothetical protein
MWKNVEVMRIFEDFTKIINIFLFYIFPKTRFLTYAN